MPKTNLFLEIVNAVTTDVVYREPWETAMLKTLFDFKRILKASMKPTGGYKPPEGEYPIFVRWAK